MRSCCMTAGPEGFRGSAPKHCVARVGAVTICLWISEGAGLRDRDVPPTNSGSEQALRPSVLFRKVTNGFRSA